MLRAFLKKNMKLPELFEEKMRRLLGEDFSEYEKHLDDPAYYGIRVNTLKISVEDFLKICPFHVTKVPWTDNGFYVDREEKPSKHPYYHAGLYYIQEPSAMTPASIPARFPAKIPYGISSKTNASFGLVSIIFAACK